jgi:hypothetical protein
LDTGHGERAPMCNLAWPLVRQGRLHNLCLNIGPRGAMRDGRVLSRNRPATPSVIKRSCQRQTAFLLVPLPRTISAVPQPSAVSRIMPARQICFCGLFRSTTTAFQLGTGVGGDPNCDTIKHAIESHVGTLRKVLNRTQALDFIH